MTAPFEAKVAWLLACEAPWVRLNTRRDILGQADDAPEVRAAYAELQAHPAVAALLDEVQDWPQPRRLSKAYDPKDSLWKLAILADFGLTRDDPRIIAVAEKVLAAHTQPPAPPGFLHGGFDHTKSWDQRPYICISHVMTYALARFGYLDDPRLQAAYDYLTAWQRLDGGWHPNDATLPGRSRELEPSCPFGVVNALRAIAANPKRRQSVTAQRAIAFILDCWERRSEPYRPVGFGMGSEFHRLHYPFVQHSLLKTVDTLSNFPAALATQRFSQMLTTVAAKTLPDGTVKADSAAKPYAAFDFGQKKAPSPWLTFLVVRAEHRYASEAL